jgi:hypothetical protein
MSRSGTFNNYLSKLRTLGYIDERGSELMATEAGMDYLAGDVPPVMITEELFEFWTGKLSLAGVTRMLRILIDHYPKGMSRSELAARSGMTRSGTFNNYLSKLRTAGLLNESQRGTVKASEVLFMRPGRSSGTADEEARG